MKKVILLFSLIITLPLVSMGPTVMPPLYCACVEGHTQEVRLLLNVGADCNEQVNLTGWTPLLAACKRGYTQIVRLLLNAGADCNQVDNSGSTPLLAASRWGYTQIVRLLLNAGADCNQQVNSTGWTPLGFAVEQDDERIAYMMMQSRRNATARRYP